MKKKSSHYWPAGYTPPSWLPDWRNEDEYSRLSSNTEYSFDCETTALKSEVVLTGKREYGWEFLRRDPFYQADYKRLIELAKHEEVLESYEQCSGLNIIVHDHCPPKSIKFHAALYRTLRNRGLGYYLLDPSIDIIDAAPLISISRLGINCYPAVNVENVSIAPGAIATPDVGKCEPIPVDGGIILGDTQTFWLFDISLPLEPQLLRAKGFLEREQLRKFKKKKSASKTDISKFTLYLRVLDADACKADDKDIMAVLFPGEDRFSYSDKHDKLYMNDKSHRNPGRDKLKNHRKAAYSLMDEGYKYLF